MKTAYIIGIFLMSAAPGHAREWPKEPDQSRMEQKSGAYKKSLMKATDDPEAALCYYKISGCDKSTLDENHSLTGAERPPRDYPQEGYLLGYDGKYHFKPSALSR